MIELESFTGRRRELMDRGTRSWIVLDTGSIPALTSDDPNTEPGPHSAQCGKCGATLVKDVNLYDVSGYVLKCPQCDSYNDLQDPDKYLG